MTKQWDDGLADKRAEYQELLFRLRMSEGVSFSCGAECQDTPSSADTPDSSDSSSLDASRWEWRAGGPPPATPTPTPPRSSVPTRGRWRRMLKHFGKLVLP